MSPLPRIKFVWVGLTVKQVVCRLTVDFIESIDVEVILSSVEVVGGQAP